MIVRVGLHYHEPDDLNDLGNQEDKFSADHDSPALRIRDPVSIHKTSHPDDEGDDCKLPEVDKRNGEVFDTVEDAKYRPFRSVL